MHTKVYRVAAFLICVVACKSELDIQGFYSVPTDYKREKSEYSCSGQSCGSPSEFTHFLTSGTLKKREILENFLNKANGIIRPDFEGMIVKNDHDNENEKKKQDVAENTKPYESARRVKRQESAGKSLLNDENLKANIEKAFSPKTELGHIQEQFIRNDQYSTKLEKKYDPAEFKPNIEMIFETVSPSLAQTVETTNPGPQPSQNPNSNQDAAKTVQKPLFQTLILKHFGPEVFSDDNTNKLETTDRYIDESTSIDDFLPTTVQETTPKITNSCQNMRTIFFLCVAYSVKVVLFFV